MNHFIISLTVTIALFLTATTSFAADKTDDRTIQSLNSIVSKVDSTSKVDTTETEENPTFGIDYKNTSKAHSVRIRADGSKLTLITEKITEPALTLIAGKITKLLPNIDLDGAKLSEDELGNPKNWSSFFDVSIAYEDARFISIILDYEIYAGGAHGQHGKLGYVIDKKKKRFVQLNELFFEQRLIKKVGPEWVEQIKKELGEEADINWITSGTKGSSNYRSFIITKDSLIIYGQSYQHNSYAEGEKTLICPLEKLKIFKKKYH